ncbi:hypothetical protein PITCH_A190064 [uncultured Desulfobacterium sp.]|uniref:Uncharacterized protein n=1 Tax=uncultured Desulfobacterium sp. TaxID=201089 RepID=A0A445MVK3_9BACT|nr:hypothetical protein PITCH_A190064 [uncultured Desulfobacterium sp.]
MTPTIISLKLEVALHEKKTTQAMHALLLTGTYCLLGAVDLPFWFPPI